MKEYNDQVMKFKITKDKLKMEISLKDLEWLFHNSPNNLDYNGEDIGVKVKRGKRQEFAEFVVNYLLDIHPDHEDNTRWGQPLEEIFMEIFEGAEDSFCKYVEENYED